MPAPTNPAEQRAFESGIEGIEDNESRLRLGTEEDLPEEEVTDELRLDDLAKHLIPLRNDAVSYREGSGIEEVWTLCEERYNGIDDANRHEFKQLKLIKPTVMNAPLTTADGGPTRDSEIKSTVFLRLTSRYVDAGSAKVAELLLSGDPFTLFPTPVPELEEVKDDKTPIVENGQPLMREATPQDVPPPMPGAPPGGPPPPEEVPVTVEDLVAEYAAKVYKSCKKAEKRIHDWLVESKYRRHMRKVIHDSARIGVGVLKGPYPDRVTKKKLLKANATEEGSLPEIKFLEKTVPVLSWRNPWNIFPDPTCGDSIAAGDYLFERDYLSIKKVLGLKKKKGYIKEAIDKILEQGPSGVKIGQRSNPSDNFEELSKKQFEVWYFTGTITRHQFMSANPDTLIPPDQDEVYAIVTIINDIVVKAALNPLHSGELNYHSIPWIRRGDHWGGVSPNEQMSTPQKVANGALRAMLNNAGISSGGQIVIDQEAVVPANGDWRLAANKIWYKTSDGVIDDVRKAFTTFEIPNRVNELLKIIEFAMRLSEESTNIPLITQGQSGDTTPNTLGATDIQNNNANQLLRDVASTYDDYLNEPLIGQFYEWLLLDPDVPDDEKEEWTIDAHVSVAKVERSIQDQTLAQILPMAVDPSYEANPKKVFHAFLRSKKIDPSDVSYTAEEIKKIKATPPPEDVGLQIAKIKAGIAEKNLQGQMEISKAEAELDMQLAQLNNESKAALEELRNQTAQLRVKLDTDRDTIYVETQRAKAQADYHHAIKKLELEREIAMMDYASKHEVTLEQVKGRLAETAMKLRTQKEISAAGLAVDIGKETTKASGIGVKKGKSLPSPVEIAGTAPKGKGFEK